jgi:hypothetical protein
MKSHLKSTKSNVVKDNKIRLIVYYYYYYFLFSHYKLLEKPKNIGYIPIILNNQNSYQ